MGAQNTSQIEMSQNTAQKEMAQNTSQKEMAQNTSQIEMSQNTSQIEMAQNTAQKEMSQNTAQIEMSQSTAQIEKSQSRAEIEMTQNATQKEMSQSTAQIESIELNEKLLRNSGNENPPPLVLYDGSDYALIPDLQQEVKGEKEIIQCEEEQLLQNQQAYPIDGPVQGEALTDMSVFNPPFDVKRGIEDLEDLLHDIGNLGVKINHRNNANTYEHDYNNNDINNGGNVGTKKNDKQQQCMSESEEYGAFPLPCSKNSKERLENDIIRRPTVNDLLFKIDKPTLAHNGKPDRTRALNLSSYDNTEDSFYGGECNSDTSLGIHAGTVAKHMKSLQSKHRTMDADDNVPKYGVPMAGIVSPASCHGQNPLSGSGKFISSLERELEIDVGYRSQHCARYNGLRTTDYNQTQFEEDDVFYKGTALLTRSDSEHGESTKSSLSPPLHLNGTTTNSNSNSTRHDENQHVESPTTTCYGNNDISSGIASRSSSMASLSSSGGQHGPYTHDKKNNFKSTTDGATQTATYSPTYSNESEQISLKSEDMKIPVQPEAADPFSTPRGILKTMGMSECNNKRFTTEGTAPFQSIPPDG